MPQPTTAAEARRRYWRANLLTVSLLLAAWAAIGLGCGVLWADWLNRFRLGGFPLGFWFAQQGSIAAFVLIVLAYAALLGRFDARLRADLERLRDRDEVGP